jgi:hypothetical protein
MKNKERLLDNNNPTEFSFELSDLSNTKISINKENDTNNLRFFKMVNEKSKTNINNNFNKINNNNNINTNFTNLEKNINFFDKEIQDDKRFSETNPNIIKEEKNMSEKEKEKFIKQQYEGYQTYCIHEEIKGNENENYYFNFFQFFEIFILHLLFSIFGIFIVPLYRLIYGRELIRNLGFWGKKLYSIRNTQYFYWICFIITIIFHMRIRFANKKLINLSYKNINHIINNKNLNNNNIVDDVFFNQYIFLSMAYMSILLVILRYLIVSIKYGFFPKSYYHSIKYKLIYKSNLKYNYISDGWINPDFYMIDTYFLSAFNYLNVNPKRFFLECVGKIDQNLEKKILELDNDFSDGHLKRRNSYMRKMKKNKQNKNRNSMKNFDKINFANFSNFSNLPNISSSRKNQQIHLKRNSIIRRYSNSINSSLNFSKQNSFNNNSNNKNKSPNLNLNNNLNNYLNNNLNHNFETRRTYDDLKDFMIEEKSNSNSFIDINSINTINTKTNGNLNGNISLYTNKYNNENSNENLNTKLDKENDYFDQLSNVKNSNFNNFNNNNNINDYDLSSNISGNSRFSGLSGLSDDNQKIPKMRPIMKLKNFVNVTLKMHINNLKKKMDLKKKSFKGKLETLNNRVYKINGLYLAKILTKKINEINVSTFRIFHLILFFLVLAIPNLFIYNLFKGIKVMNYNNNINNINNYNINSYDNLLININKTITNNSLLVKNDDNNYNHNNNNSINNKVFVQDYNNDNNQTNKKPNNYEDEDKDEDNESYNPFNDFKLISFNYISIIFLIFSLISAIIPVWLNTEHLIYGLIDFSRRRKSMELLYQILNPKNIECNIDLPIVNITDHITLINWYILRQVLMNFGKRFTDRIMIQTSLFGIYFIFLLCWLFLILFYKMNINMGILVKKL